MITKPTIDRIMEATDIVEVIGEFVQLKKRGANYIGLSPFVNERTPSFTVSPVKGIFKDFSSGKGGSAVTFLMELEKLSYPEALKWLAKKYGIEVEETETSPENKEAENRRESLMIVSGYAGKFFQDSLWDTDEGQSIGLSYFKERGFTTETIKKFELGYSPDQWEAFSSQALKDGYQEEFMVESGLSVKRDNGNLYDRYRGRVMFPIHSFTGRVIAFGGRTLKTDKNVPKYVNSPESEIYHKSNVLYGLNFAKKAIRDEDNCYLVEGYADVISVHQAGIENVVASSGTSLTVEQIKLIGRLTKNVTILYDGDAAGIKASLRGLDLILEEGLNVKVVLFPDGHDPDTYVRLLGSSAFKKYIDDNRKDFILYKTDILLKEAGKDPILKAGVIREVVESIAKIPDSIKASVFIKECSSIMQIDERALLTELNKMRQAKARKDSGSQQMHTPFDDAPIATEPEPIPSEANGEAQEMKIISLLIEYGDRMIDWDGITNTYVGPFIVAEISDVDFEHFSCNKFIEMYRREIDNGKLPDDQFFINYPDPMIVNLAVDALTKPYELSENWYNMHKIHIPDIVVKNDVFGGIFHLKRVKIEKMLVAKSLEIKNCDNEIEIEILLHQHKTMKKVQMQVLQYFGTVISK